MYGIPRREAGKNFLRQALGIIRLGKKPLPDFFLPLPDFFLPLPDFSLPLPDFFLAVHLTIHLAQDLIHRPLHQSKAEDCGKDGEGKHDKGPYAKVHFHTAFFVWMSKLVAVPFPLTLSLSRKGRGDPKTTSSYKCKPI
jgi:hypothetical protein